MRDPALQEGRGAVGFRPAFGVFDWLRKQCQSDLQSADSGRITPRAPQRSTGITVAAVAAKIRIFRDACVACPGFGFSLRSRCPHWSTVPIMEPYSMPSGNRQCQCGQRMARGRWCLRGAIGWPRRRRWPSSHRDAPLSQRTPHAANQHGGTGACTLHRGNREALGVTQGALGSMASLKTLRAKDTRCMAAAGSDEAAQPAGTEGRTRGVYAVRHEGGVEHGGVGHEEEVAAVCGSGQQRAESAFGLQHGGDSATWPLPRHTCPDWPATRTPLPCPASAPAQALVLRLARHPWPTPPALQVRPLHRLAAPPLYLSSRLFCSWIHCRVARLVRRTARSYAPGLNSGGGGWKGSRPRTITMAAAMGGASVHTRSAQLVSVEEESALGCWSGAELAQQAQHAAGLAPSRCAHSQVPPGGPMAQHPAHSWVLASEAPSRTAGCLWRQTGPPGCRCPAAPAHGGAGRSKASWGRDPELGTTAQSAQGRTLDGHEGPGAGGAAAASPALCLLGLPGPGRLHSVHSRPALLSSMLGRQLHSAASSAACHPALRAAPAGAPGTAPAWAGCRSHRSAAGSPAGAAPGAPRRAAAATAGWLVDRRRWQIYRPWAAGRGRAGADGRQAGAKANMGAAAQASRGPAAQSQQSSGCSPHGPRVYSALQ